jgi:polysaccharide export outer membrane protein
MFYILKKSKAFKLLFTLVLIALFSSCTSKKDILYFQDANTFEQAKVVNQIGFIQPNDILSIQVEALVQESAIPYNKQVVGNGGMQNIEILRLQGYLVDEEGSIKFPVLGKLTLAGMKLLEAETYLEALLEEGNHLSKPKVTIRYLNAKFTILGEVRSPGTYTYTEQFITLPQALGYAGDLSINARRDDVMLLREENGNRTVYTVDLTSTDWLNDPSYTIRQNDIIIVNPNDAKVKSAGFIGNSGTVLSIVSFLLTSIVLITR